MPENIRHALFQGMKDWGVWEWNKNERSVSEFEGNSATGSLSEALFDSWDNDSFKRTEIIDQDIRTRLEYSRMILNLNESLDDLFSIFINEKIIESWIKAKNELQKRREKGSR